MIFLYYIKEIDKLNICGKVFLKIKKNENKSDNASGEIIIPKLYSDWKAKDIHKLVKKIVKILEKLNCNKIILSNEIKKNKLFVNYLYTYGLEISDGKWLFEILSDKVLEYIISKKRLNKDEIYISILINDISSISLENIKSIIMKYKKVNIVTKHIGKFKKIEEQILENIGKSVYISNNKKKCLIKSNVILNIDFSEEEINKYNIYDEAIIVNLKQNVKINRKRFIGINISDFEIKYIDNELDLLELSLEYSLKEIYESKLSTKLLYQEIFEKIKKDSVEIEYLQGNNTRIW